MPDYIDDPNQPIPDRSKLTQEDVFGLILIVFATAGLAYYAKEGHLNSNILFGGLAGRVLVVYIITAAITRSLKRSYLFYGLTTLICAVSMVMTTFGSAHFSSNSRSPAWQSANRTSSIVNELPYVATMTSPIGSDNGDILN